MTSDELVAVIMAGDAAALQWYSTTTGKPIAANTNAPVFSTPLPGGGGVNVTQGSLLVIGVILVAAVLFLK